MGKSVVKKVCTVIAGLSLVSLSMGLNAQNFDVSKFEETVDSDARLAQVKDHNDKLCAMIKIASSLDCNGFIGFDAGNAQVVKSECENGLRFVFISPGATKLSIRHKTAGNKENYSFPTGPLEVGTVYLMTLKSETEKIIETEAYKELKLGNEFLEKKDTIKARAQYLRSANRGNATAQNRLGYMYETIDKDYVSAEKWYNKSAEQGYAEAQYNLGLLYEFGYGVVRKNKKKAKSWYRKAAEQGLFEAKKRLETI
ncbi:hypothetical protein FACS1894199_14250 [Bacteroidia bacterium]|nr:hypothetical protein FACS1894199_14250 [Bacteroidia bacterium]